MIRYHRNADGMVIHIECDGHLVMTGPIRGTVTCADGTIVDVTGPGLEATTPAQAAEIAHLIGLRYATEGHPDDVELDPATGRMVSVPFEYIPQEGKS